MTEQQDGATPHPGDGFFDDPASDRDEQFSAFMAVEAPRLQRYAWLLTGDPHRAEELVQQALVRTYVAWPRAAAGEPAAYARRTLSNLRIDGWRRHRREVLLAPQDVPQGATDEGSLTEDRDRLVRALRCLPERRRKVVVLRYLLDLPEAQVADALRISTGTVRSTASRALAELRTLMADADVGERGSTGARTRTTTEGQGR